MTASPAIRTASVYGSLLLMVGVMLPFLPVWLAARGFSIAEVATALALQSVVRVVAMPVLTYWADRLEARRRFIISLSVAASVMMLAANLVDGVWPVTVCIVLAALAWAPVMPMLDTVAVEQSEAGLYDYGKVRIAGSVTFIWARSGLVRHWASSRRSNLAGCFWPRTWCWRRAACCCRSWERPGRSRDATCPSRRRARSC